MTQILHPPQGSREETQPGFKLQSTQLLIDAGYVHVLGDGLFGFLPLGVRVLKALSGLIAEELERLGGEEMVLPLVNPVEPWENSERNLLLADELTLFRDRCGRELTLAPMHEEAVLELVRQSINSVDQLPRFLFQFQDKFRDEADTGYGLLKAREFVMADAYSFHRSFEELNNFMPRIFSAYANIFRKLGLNAVSTEGASGFSPGAGSYDFILRHGQGEDVLVSCPHCGYSANQDIALANPRYQGGRPLEMEEMESGECFDLACMRQTRGLPKSRTAEGRIYATAKGYVFVVFRSDRSISRAKLSRLTGSAVIRELTEEELEQLGFTRHSRPMKGRRRPGPPTAASFISPLGFTAPDLPAESEFLLAVDNSVAESSNLIFSLGWPGRFVINVNFGRDFDADLVGDVSLVEKGTPCYHCGHALTLQRGIKLGSIYRIGDFFTRKRGFSLVDIRGQQFYPSMGGYGIGLGRLMASLVEAHRYRRGFIWPMRVAPFRAGLIIVGRSETIHEIGSKLHERLGSTVLLDDRKVAVNRKFRDLSRMGIPTRIVISGQTLDDGKAMICHRRLCAPMRIQLNHIESRLQELEEQEQGYFAEGHLFPLAKTEASAEGGGR